MDGSHTICAAAGTVYTCSLNFGNTGSLLYATYDTSHTTCAQDYCVFGEDSSSNYFCCETAPGTLTGMAFNGGLGVDTIQLHYPETTLDDYGAGGQGFFVTVHGYGGADEISASPTTTSTYFETLYGDQGDDYIIDSGGVSLIYGGSGMDNISLLSYASGTVYGEDDDDLIECAPGSCLAYGGAGDDILQAGASGVVFHGGPGDDVLQGGDGVDELYGEDGIDSLHGGDDADSLYGGDDDDYLCGDAGVDLAYGQVGADVLYDTDADTLDGGLGSDTCWNGTPTRTSCTLTSMSYPCSYYPP